MTDLSILYVVPATEDSGALSRRCLQCGDFHSPMNPYRCEAEIASHSGQAEDTEAGLRALRSIPSRPALSPIMEEAMEQLANAGAIR